MPSWGFPSSPWRSSEREKKFHGDDDFPPVASLRWPPSGGLVNSYLLRVASVCERTEVGWLWYSDNSTPVLCVSVRVHSREAGRIVSPHQETLSSAGRFCNGSRSW